MLDEITPNEKVVDGNTFDFLADYSSSDYDYISDDELEYMERYQGQNVKKFADLRNKLHTVTNLSKRGTFLTKGSVGKS